MNILLACAAGMSTSLLVTKMKKAAKEQGKDYKIWATDVGSIEDEDDEFDIVMLGPQVAWREEEAREMVDKKIPLVVIDKQAYGSCDGAAVLKTAEEIIENTK